MRKTKAEGKTSLDEKIVGVTQSTQVVFQWELEVRFWLSILLSNDIYCSTFFTMCIIQLLNEPNWIWHQLFKNLKIFHIFHTSLVLCNFFMRCILIKPIVTPQLLLYLLLTHLSWQYSVASAFQHPAFIFFATSSVKSCGRHQWTRS